MSHIHKDIDFTAEVFVVFKNRVLLRKHDKYAIWLGVGGHIELNEDPNEAAVREVKEEVGLDVTLVGPVSPQGINGDQELIAPFFMNRHRPGGDPNHEHVALIYFALTENETITPENPTDEWHWFTVDELKMNDYGIMSNILFYAEQALKKLSSPIV